MEDCVALVQIFIFHILIYTLRCFVIFILLIFLYLSQYFRFKFGADIDRVLVRVTSTSKLCGMVLIQNSKVPQFSDFLVFLDEFNL